MSLYVLLVIYFIWSGKRSEELNQPYRALLSHDCWVTHDLPRDSSPGDLLQVTLLQGADFQSAVATFTACP